MKRFIIILAVILMGANGFAQDTEKDGDKGKPATIWDTLSGPSAGISITAGPILTASGKLVSLSVARDGTIAANSESEVYIWSPAGLLVKTLPLKSTSLSFANDGRHLITCDLARKRVIAWDTANWKTAAETTGIGESVCNGSQSLPLVAIWGWPEDDVLVWNFLTGDRRKIWSGPHGMKKTQSVFQPYTYQSVRQAAFSPDGRFLAVAREAHNSEDQVLILETASGRKVKSFFNCSNTYNSVAYVEYNTAGDQIVTNGYSCTILVREADTGITLGRFPNDNEWSVPIPRFTPDGRYVFYFDRKGGFFRPADGSKGGLNIAEARQVGSATGTDIKLEITQENVAEAIITSPAFSHDGKRLIWLEKNNVHIWNLQGIGPAAAP
jgi:WD40 repeat protein